MSNNTHTDISIAPLELEETARLEGSCDADPDICKKKRNEKSDEEELGSDDEESCSKKRKKTPEDKSAQVHIDECIKNKTSCVLIIIQSEDGIDKIGIVPLYKFPAPIVTANKFTEASFAYTRFRNMRDPELKKAERPWKEFLERIGEGGDLHPFFFKQTRFYATGLDLHAVVTVSNYN